MDIYKKERSSKQHLKIDLGQDQSQDDIFMLANPMTYGDVTTPTSPPNSAQSSHTAAISPNTPTNTHTGSFSRGFERLSLKSKSKNQSFFKIFSRNSSSGGNTNVHKDEEYAGDASSGSDHEDPFSPNFTIVDGDSLQSSRQMSEPPKSPTSGHGDQYTSLPRQIRRHHSGGHSSRDSGFSSERESISHIKDDNAVFRDPNGEGPLSDVRVSPSYSEEYQEAGMEALEILHNQLQLLVKRDSDEDTDSVCVYEQVIANLSKQLEAQSLALDSQRHSETNLRISLKLAEQRTLEAETKLCHVVERCIIVEKKCVNVSAKYKSLRRKQQQNMEQQKSETERRPLSSKSPHHSLSGSSLQHSSAYQQPPSHTSPQSGDSLRIFPQRVQSQTLYDRLNKLEQSIAPSQRPSTAQGFHDDQNNVVSSISSLSHTETSV